MAYKYTPIQGTNIPAIVSQMNRNLASLDKETVTKSFGGKNGTEGVTIGRIDDTMIGMLVTQSDKKVMFQGIYTSGRAGTIYYDENEVARILVGQAPGDGRMGAWISNVDVDVLTLLGG